MLIVAHRGGNPDDVENSAAAFRHGVESGADLLECDLQLSATGDIVLFHATRYFGTPVRAFSTDELRGLIPTLLTLDEFLDLVNEIERETRLVLDLKTRDVDRVLAGYLERDELWRRVLVTSTFAFSLWRLKRRFPELRTGLSRGATINRLPQRLRPLAAMTVGRVIVLLAVAQMAAFGIETAVMNFWLVDSWSVGLFHRLGRRIYVWTVDDTDRVRQFQAFGIDYLTTNIPTTITPCVRCR